MYKRDIEACLNNHCCREKAIGIAYSECMFVCVCSLSYPACNAHALCMSSVACPFLPYFSTLSHKSTILGGKKLLNIKCMF
jgi:hypothetical protein